MKNDSGLNMAYKFIKSSDRQMKQSSASIIALVGNEKSVKVLEDAYKAEEKSNIKSFINFSKERLLSRLKSEKKNFSQSPLFSHISQDISWKMIFTSITIVIMGYILLSNVDPLGKNIYSILAPIFLIGGHILVALGLLYCPQTSKNSK